ncbi:GNAT family N-acetyltransferase [Paenibacillus sp. N4]|uniref:GNAT family N-acetyltransferase n=1 Tax=Paenibacillus vietnamensis TaxID=2590547 RepID=UPI001CD104F1|nr:GNAT family N-acetyltransferase [Paenibacillus vietnamensis]MCA0758650.1 GNAT family N-acetyltransferase [Paenibacillus vietnamensis]
MEWYEKLNDYFPEHEMKHPQQLKELIEENEFYHKEETDDYIMLYADFPTFVFIDYLLVTSNTRGKGMGTKILDRLKARGKLIILEAEPVMPKDSDSERRLTFYYRNGFKKADLIRYTRRDEQDEPYTMHVLYWSPAGIPQAIVLEKMELACDEIHNFRSKRHYGRQLVDLDEALDWKN